MVITFQSPSCFWLAGPTGSGKSYFTRTLIRNRDVMFQSKPVVVHYAFKEWQSSLFGEMQRKDGVHFHQGLPSTEQIKTWSQEVGGRHMLLVLDDLQHEVCTNSEMASVFSVLSHHCNISVLFLVQNVFAQGRASRDACLNCHYLILFNSKRDLLQVSNLARQICPGKNTFFMSAYEDAVSSRKYKYLVIDLHPTTPREYMLRTNIFPEDSELTWVYLPK